MPSQEDLPNSGAIGTIGVVGALAMVAITWALTAVVRTELDQHEVAIGGYAAVKPVRDLVAAQQSELSAPASFADRGAGTVHVPIDRAKQLVLADLKRDPNRATAPSPPVAAPATSDSAATAGSAAPADSAAPAGSAAPAPPASASPAGSAAALPAPAPHAPAPGAAPAPPHPLPAPAPAPVPVPAP